jgi:DNA-binding transcriptional regulator YiaG
MYQYKESGLDNVYLENGYRQHKTPYGEGISIIDTESLHRAIGHRLITMQSPLNGAELRFLRLEMDTTQKDLASMLGTTEQTLRLWEKNRTKSINGTADRLLRALYADYVGGKGSVRRMLKRLADIRESEHTTAYFRADKKGWSQSDDQSSTVSQASA